MPVHPGALLSWSPQLPGTENEENRIVEDHRRLFRSWAWKWCVSLFTHHLWITYLITRPQENTKKNLKKELCHELKTWKLRVFESKLYKHIQNILKSLNLFIYLINICWAYFMSRLMVCAIYKVLINLSLYT